MRISIIIIGATHIHKITSYISFAVSKASLVTISLQRQTSVIFIPIINKRVAY